MKLAKWEHTGFTDLRLAAEASQRKLHKCYRAAAAAVQQPVASVFMLSASKLGLPALQALLPAAAADTHADQVNAPGLEAVGAEIVSQLQQHAKAVLSGAAHLWLGHIQSRSAMCKVSYVQMQCSLHVDFAV